MMTVFQTRRRWAVAALLPPGLYWQAASLLLWGARKLFGWKAIGGRGLSRALGWSNSLSRTGMSSWRARGRRP